MWFRSEGRGSLVAGMIEIACGENRRDLDEASLADH
jgi:hypothetical protein